MYEYNDPLGETKFKRLNSPYYIKSKFQGILYSEYKAGEKYLKIESWVLLQMSLVNY